MSIARLIDSTLREGNQSPAVRFTEAASVVIARLLDRIGVDMIECGHACASRTEFGRIEAVVNLGLRAPILGHARACVADVDATADTGATWVGIFAGVNEISRKSRLSARSQIEVIDMIVRAVARAKERGLKVRYTVEDASRTDQQSVFDVFDRVLQAGVDRICIADTLGLMLPGAVRDCITALRVRYPNVEIETHFHDDRGLAIANTMTALDCGARWASTSVNGIGERCGITDLATLIGNLAFEEPGHFFGRDMEALQELSRYVGAVSRSPPDARRPVVGRNAFTHTSRLHLLAMARDPRAYSWCEPEKLHREAILAEPPTSSIDDYIVKPKPVCATELKYHRSGPGTRYLFVDDRVVANSHQYCIVRDIPPVVEQAPGHVDEHKHICDSLFLFVGKNSDLSGLTVDVVLGGETRRIESPAAVHIPAGVSHRYSVVSGTGYYINHVQNGLYQTSLLETETFLDSARVVSAGTQVSETTIHRGRPSYIEFSGEMKRFLANRLGVDVSEIDDTTSIFSGNRIDSIDLLEMVLMIGDRWGQELFDGDIDPARIGSISDLYGQLLAQRGSISRSQQGSIGEPSKNA